MVENDQSGVVESWRRPRFATETCANLIRADVGSLDEIILVIYIVGPLCPRKDVIFALETLDPGRTAYVIAEDGLYRIARERNYTMDGPLGPEECIFRSDDLIIFFEKE